MWLKREVKYYQTSDLKYTGCLPCCWCKEGGVGPPEDGPPGPTANQKEVPLPPGDPAILADGWAGLRMDFGPSLASQRVIIDTLYVVVSPVHVYFCFFGISMSICVTLHTHIHANRWEVFGTPTFCKALLLLLLVLIIFCMHTHTCLCLHMCKLTMGTRCAQNMKSEVKILCK